MPPYYSIFSIQDYQRKVVVENSQKKGGIFDPPFFGQLIFRMYGQDPLHVQ
jgi:hypothetical protein